MESPERPWSEPAEAVLAGLDVERAAGLAEHEVAARRARFGANSLRHRKRRPWARILLDQLKSFIVLLLAVGAAVSFAFGHHVEGGAIVVVIALNAALGFATELKAVRSMEALRGLGNVTTTVRRGGRARRIPAAELVVGDVVLLEGGDVITADLRVVEGSRLQADESTLTG
ncbi:MAG TPA: cation-transporting P-type ATPase, partial [Polyangiaceae bacterium LLY-WYZ-15_(1-7)]|nr:cation-transporting P-type ATPase [Polyangiaceae bacterium LLY-WYZ-15_(1-7)]